MSIEATKLELMQLLLHTQKKSVLAKLKRVFEEESTDWWGEMNTEEKEEIQVGMKQADRGEYIDQNEIKKHFQKWH